MAKYDIHNPTKGPRVIYDGLPKDGAGGAQSSYTISPGATRSGIELSDGIASDLKNRPKGTDLQLTPHDKSDHEPDQSLDDKPADAAQKQNDSTGKTIDPTMRQTRK